MDNILVSNIQRFSIHDGPGIRTTVFLKGCSLRCPWCSNPESIEPFVQQYIKDGIVGYYGKIYSSSELIKEILKDCAYYGGELEKSLWKIKDPSLINYLPGGVTFSGGEPLLQINELSNVLNHLRDRDIHITFETSLYIPQEYLISSLEFGDLFYVDIKTMDDVVAKEIQKGELALYKRNFDILIDSGKPVVIRVPVIGEYTDTDDNVNDVISFLSKYKERILKIELIKEHNLAESKYASLGYKINYHGVSDSFMEEYKQKMLELCVPVDICKV